MLDKIQSLLTENERILNQARIHWIVFAAPATLCVIGAFASVLFHPLMGLVFLFLALYPAYNAFIHYTMTNLVLTNKKVMSRMGFLSRDWTRMDFDRIENAFLEEPIIGRYLGYSTVVISGIGSGNIAVSQVVGGDKFVKDLEKRLADHKATVKAV